MRRYWPLLLLALVPVIPLWRAVFLGESIGAFDQIRQMAPWNAPAPKQPWDVLQADSVLQFYPWRDMVFEAWGKGEIPAWNPYELAGTPLLANSQSAGFYPPHILVGALHIPTGSGMTLLAWLHLFWAGFGVYRLCLRLGATRLGAVFGGVSFQLSAYMVSWAALPSVIATCAWIPWCLWATHGVFGYRTCPSSDESADDPVPEPTLGRALRNAVRLAVCVSMMLLAGHLQFAAYGLMAVALAAVWLAVYHDAGQVGPAGRVGQVGAVIAGVALGFCLAAPQLLPVLRYSQYAHRQNSASEEGYQAYVSSALGIESAAILYPGLVGLPTKFSAQAPELSEYWPGLYRRGANFAESAIAISPLILALALLGIGKRVRRHHGMALVGLFALLLAFGTPLNKLLYFYFPGWSSTGSPARVSVLFVLALCVLAGLGVRRSWLTDKSMVRYAAIVSSTIACVLVALAFFYVPGAVRSRFDPSFDMSAYVSTSQLPHLPLALASILAIGIVFYAFGRSLKDGGLALIGMAVALPSAQYATRLVPTGLPLAKVPGPAMERIAVINEPWELMTAPPASLPPNTASLSRIHEIGGYDSLLHKDTKAMLDGINGQDSAPPANGNMMFVKPGSGASNLMAAGISEIWSRIPLSDLRLRQAPPNFRLPYTEFGGLHRFRLMGSRATVDRPLPPRGSPPLSTRGEIMAESYSSLTLRAKGPGRLVVRDRNMPGWSAEVDGKPARLEGALWREVELPRGQHTVKFSYDPPGMTAGLFLCLLAASALLSLMVVGRARPIGPRDLGIEVNQGPTQLSSPPDV